MKCLLAFALLMTAVPAASATRVQVAEGDWSFLPLLKKRANDSLNNDALARINEIVHKGTCTLPGQDGPHYDVTLSFAVRFTPQGTIDRLIMNKLNCAEIEGLLGGALLEMLKAGDYKPTNHNPEGWYRGELGFGGQG